MRSLKIISLADPAVATFGSWFFLFIMGNIEMSQYSRALEKNTNILLLSILFATSLLISKRRKPVVGVSERINNLPVLIYLTIFVVGFFVNIIFSGYVPLIKLILTGESDYLEFGLKSISGFLNAIGCGLLVLATLLLQEKGRAKKIIYYFIFIVVLSVFVLSYTRQNILTSFVQIGFVMYIIGKINLRKIVVFATAFLFLFSFAGSFRSGDIKEIAKIKEEYLWVPEPIIWLYSYSYFNVLNLENVTKSPDVPKLDGSSFSTLLPSVLRTEKEESDFLAVSNFNVKSAASDLYYDMGFWGVMFTFFILTLSAIKVYSIRSHTPYTIYCVSVLWFCGAFSFFVNFWFYLPVISQLIICYPLFKYTFVGNKDRNLLN